MNPVVVALDGSRFAEVALPLGRKLAEAMGGELHLVHVLGTPLPGAFHPEESLLFETHMRGQAGRYLEEQAAWQRSRGPLEVRTQLLPGEQGVAPALAEYAAQAGARWLVLTTHGAGGVSRMIRGSVADALARGARTPLLFVRPWDPTDSLEPGEPRLRWILVPLDGSEEAEAALAPAAELARAVRASLSLVRVVPPRAASGMRQRKRVGAGSTAIEREAAFYLEERVEELRERGVAAESWLVASANPAAGVLTAAVERGADLILMATHGRSGLQRALLGGVTDEVLQKATAPLAVVRPQADQATLAERAI
jgi:nucleotide-binding universal stress UspA family protein